MRTKHNTLFRKKNTHFTLEKYIFYDIFFIMKDKVRYCYENRSSHAELVSILDLHPSAAGFAVDVDTWPHNPHYTADPYHRIYLPLSGHFTLTTLDEEKNIKKGSIFLIPGGQPLRFTAGTPCTHYWCHFYSEHLNLLLHGNLIREIPLKVSTKYISMFKKMLILLSSQTTVPEAMELRNITGTMVSEFLQNELDTSALHLTPDDAITDAAKFLEDNFFQKISIRKLGSKYNMSESAFYKSFKARYGISPRCFLTRKRLNTARKLLLTSSQKTVNQIADQCGFENLPLFYRSFKKEFGFTPLAFRKKKQ